MFQVHVPKAIDFQQAEPKHPSNGPVFEPKKTKHHSPIKEYLEKLKKELNQIIGSEISSEGLKHSLRGFLREISELVTNTDNVRSVLSKMKDELIDLAAGLENYDILKPFMALLDKPLPDDRGSLVSKGSGVRIKVPSAHVVGPSAPRYGDSHDATEGDDLVDDSEDESDVKSCGHTGECKCSDDSTSKRERYGVLEIGKTYLVSLYQPERKRKLNKVTRLLKDGPRELALFGVGSETLTFITKHDGAKSVTGTVLISDVIVEQLTSGTKPTELLPQMLIEMRWDGDPNWYDVRYTPGVDGSQAATIFKDNDLVDFDINEDDWRYPDYAMLVEEDEIIVSDIDGQRVAIVTEAQGDGHTYVCEWSDRKKVEDRTFTIDLWYSRVRMVGESTPKDEQEAHITSEEEDDDVDYEVDEEVRYRGSKYKVISVDTESGDDVQYELKSRDDEKTITVTQTQIYEDWDPSYSEGMDIVYKGRAGSIVAIDYESRTYELEMDDEEELNASEEDLTLLEPPEHAVGSVVFYNYDFYRVVSNRLTYVLEPENGGSEVDSVTEDDLRDWILYVTKGKWEILHIIKRKLKKVKNKGGTVPMWFYTVVNSKGGKPKEIRNSPKNVKHQSEAKSYFDDAEKENDDDLDKVIKFENGEEVLMIIDGATTIKGVIMDHHVGDTLDDETYDIESGGELYTKVAVGQIDKLDKDKVVEEAVGDLATDENGDQWILSRFDGEQAVWDKVEEPGEDSSSSESDSSSSEDDEDEGDFNVDDYVTIGGDRAVYQVTRVSGNVYDLISAWDMDGTVYENISGDDIRHHDNEYEEGDMVTLDGVAHRVAEASDGGMYVLDNGEDVTEDELLHFVDRLPNKTIVRVNGTREVFAVKSYKDGQYVLKNVVDGVEITSNQEDVDRKEGPEFEKGDYVQLCSERYPRKVKTAASKKYTYKLEGLPERIFRESELGEPRYEPKFDQGDSVHIGSGGTVFKIKKVIREEGSYILSDGTKHHEDELEEVEEEEED